MKKITLGVMAVLLLAWAAFASPALMPAPKIQFFDNSGNVLNAGKVYTYEAGTTTNKASYTDSTGAVANTNPVILDTAGRANIWLNGLYKIKVCTSVDTQCITTDNVSAVPSSDLVANTEWVASGLTPTYLTATTFSVPGDYTTTFQEGRRLKIVDSGGTDYASVTGSSFAVGVTTVTVINDSTVLDAGLSSVSLGILTLTNPSQPVTPTVTKTDDYPMTATDVNKIFIFNKATAVAATLKAANLVPSGSWITFKNIGAGTLTLTGTVDGESNPIVTTSHATTIFSNGTVWYYQVEQVLKTKSVSIGDWNMDTTGSVVVPHGLTFSRIRSIRGIIRDDADSLIYVIGESTNLSEADIYFGGNDATNVGIIRRTGGPFDTTSYDSTSYNRGWIVIDYN